MPSVSKLIIAVFFLMSLPAKVHALTPAEVFDKVKDAVVVVKTMDDKGKMKGQGSGVLLPSGKIATNCHVIEGGAFYWVGQGKQLLPATLYAEDGDKDVCLLDAKLIKGKSVQLGKATNLKIGEPVYAVGAPQGLELSLSDGIVAQLRGGPPPFIQITAAISPGSSGGGLFDKEGRLVGLTTLYIEGGQSLNFAIPVEWIGEVKPGRKPYAYLKNKDAIEARLEIDPELPDVLDLLFPNEFKEKKDWKGYLSSCQREVKTHPKDYAKWFYLGKAYHYLKRYKDAIGAYSQALRISPESANTWNNLAIEYALSGNRADALNAIRELRRLDPERADKLFNLIVPR